MKKIYSIFLSSVVAFLGFQSIVSAQSSQQVVVVPDSQVLEDLKFYENSAAPSPKGISYNKIISQPNTNGVYNIFLEAFVTGEKTSVQKSIGSDIVLVLDVSSSMVNNNVTNVTYNPDGEATTGWTYNSAQDNRRYVEYPAGSGSFYAVRQNSNGGQYYLRFSVSGTWYYLSGNSIVGSRQEATGVNNGTTVIWTGQLYTQTSTSMTRLQALKDAVGVFLDTIHADDVKDPSNPLGHKVSIVKFSGSYVGGSADAAMTPGNHGGDTNDPTTEVFKNWTLMTDQSVVNQLKTDVNSIATGHGTSVDYGMNLAYKLLSGLTIDANNPRARTVVLFSDGSPYRQTTADPLSEGNIADAAINTANTIKLMKAYTTEDGDVYTKIFSVGTLGSNPSGTALAVLQRCSSNYKDATSRTTGTVESNAYYYLAEDAESLKSTFETIGSMSGGASYTMDSETTATVDVISQSFMLPKNADVNSIAVWTADCIGKYTSGDLNGFLMFDDYDDWVDGREQGLVVQLSSDKQKVTVTNFDYSANWCGTETKQGVTTYRGKKLILGIPIQMATSAVGGKDLNTNAEGSGIIVNNENILPFNVPHVSLPVNLWVRKEGLEEGESARFTIQRARKPVDWPAEDSDDYPENSLDDLYETLTWKDVSSIFVTRHKGQDKTGVNAPVTKAVGLPSVDDDDTEFIYRVVENTDWSWSYTPGTTTIFTSDQLVTNPFIFSNTKKTDIDVKVRHAESKATNTFKSGNFVVDNVVVKVVNASNVSYDDSKPNTGTGRATQTQSEETSE